MDLRRSLGAILDSVSAGERIVVARDHRPLAVLIPVEDARRFDEEREERIRRRLAALDRLDRLSGMLARESKLGADHPPAADLIREDRSRDDPDEPDEGEPKR